MELHLRGGGILQVGEGRYVELKTCVPERPEGLHKVWIWGETGRELLLGTLIPDHHRLCLRRTLSRTELERAGCWPIVGGEVRPAGGEREEWYRTDAPETLVRDPQLKRYMRGAALCRKNGGLMQIAMKMERTQPVPVECAATSGTILKICNEYYIMWNIGENGEIVIHQ